MDPLFITNYIRNLVARLAQGGWRPAFGWGGGFVILWAYKFAFIDAPSRAIHLSGEHLTALNVAAGIFIGAFITREVGKHLERTGGSPTGGLVNNAALS